MPIFMDRHFIEGVSHHAIADAHQKDLKYQSKYGVTLITYWSVSSCLQGRRSAFYMAVSEA